MPKKISISANGLKFEDALKRMLNTPPPPSSKKSKAGKSKRKK
jgi:hypothetical protein